MKSESKSPPDIIFLNQSLSPLFLEMNVAVANKIGKGVIYTGSFSDGQIGALTIHHAPKYDMKSGLSRLLAWLKYMVYVTAQCFRLSGKPFVFVSTNPPFLAFLAYLLRKCRKWDYAVLVWDIYPDVLTRFGRLSDRNLIVRLWRTVNRYAYEEAKVVITIGQQMAHTLEAYLPEASAERPILCVIPNWVDVELIRPIAPESNWFANRYNQIDKLTILYSGNIGITHDLNAVIVAAGKLKSQWDISFLLIGEGEGRGVIEEAITQNELDNVLVLDKQPYDIIPFSMSSGDVAVVSLAQGAEGLSMPSKTYFMMAAGCAILGISDPRSDLCQTIEQYNIGINVRPGDAEALAEAILRFKTDRDFLRLCRENARRTAVNCFSVEAVQRQYEDLLVPLARQERI